MSLLDHLRPLAAALPGDHARERATASTAFSPRRSGPSTHDAVRARLGQVLHRELADASERRPHELLADVIFPPVRCDEVQAADRLRGPGGKVQHPHDPGIDGRGVLDLEGRRGLLSAPVEPDHVDERDRFHVGERWRERFDAAVAQAPATEQTGPVVRGNPDGEPEREAEVTQPALDLGVRPVSLAPGFQRLTAAERIPRARARGRLAMPPLPRRRLPAVAAGSVPFPRRKGNRRRHRGRSRAGPDARR